MNRVLPDSPAQRHRLENAVTWAYAIATIAALLLWFSRRVFAVHAHVSWAEAIFWTLNIPAAASLVSVVGLFLLTVGLLYRKRLALWMVIVMQIIGGLWAAADAVLILLSNEPKTLDRPNEQLLLLIASVVIAVIAVPVLLSLRSGFPSRIPRGSWTGALGTLLIGLVLATAATQVLLMIWPGSSGNAWQQTVTVLMRAIGASPPLSWDVHVAHLVPQIASFIMVIAIIAATVIFLRSTRSDAQWNPTSALLAAKMIAENGDQDSLSYFNTRSDKLLHFSADGKAAVAYRTIAGVCLASSDPLGDPHSWPQAITSWQDEARRYGSIPAVLSCSEAGARAYNKVLGYGILQLGDEAILTQERFRLDSTTMTEVRRAVKRARRDGLSVRIAHCGDLDPAELAEINAAAEKWRDGDERGFSMALGRFGDPADWRVVVATVHDANAKMVALQSFVPWGRHGLSLDLMRRSPDAPNGTNEFLTAELMKWCDDHGVDRVSLNFAFFRQVFASAEDVAAPTYRKVNSQLLSLLDRFWQIRSLYQANAKYNPQWTPRYVALANPLTIFHVAIACLMAEGFLKIPFTPAPKPGALAFNAEQLAELKQIDTSPPPGAELDVKASDQTRQRLTHLAALEAAGRPGYPVGHQDAIWLSSAQPDLQTALPGSVATAEHRLAGRIRHIRNHGGVCFADLTDRHADFQLLLDAEELGRGELHEFSRLVDSGDIIEATGRLGISRNGTQSLLVSNWTMLAKAIHPVPWQGIVDPRTKARNRSLDLLVNPDELDLLLARSRAVSAVRQTLLDEGFCEVETPILGTTNGGATARPFRTHINAYDTDLVLRIAPELALKRLLVAGMGPIFEIGRNFRNEGVDATHNPEFTAIEAYQPLADYTDMRLLTQRIIQNAATAVHGRAVLPLPDASGRLKLTDISADWPVITMTDAVSTKLGREISIHTDLDELIDIARDLEIDLKEGLGPGAVLEELYGKLVESSTVMPTFYTDFPEESSPLTARHRTKPGLVERWDLVAGGMELGTAYSELADPLIQRSRLAEQSWLAAQSDPEAMELDEDFLRALELGMAPTGGLGIGVDRLVMAITGTTIRQVLTFPFVRPAGK